jgi:molybdate transport system substrate-binding protein
MKAKITSIVFMLLSVFMLQRAEAQSSSTLVVFAASSLADVFGEIGIAFKTANPGVDVVFNFGSSSTLATQLKDGAPADVFASANTQQMDVARAAGRIMGDPATFAKNRLVLAVPIDNPAHVESLHDLARPGVKLVVAGPNVPVRVYTNTMLDKMAKLSEYGEDYRAAVVKNIVSEEDNVRQVTAKLALGEADAGIVYCSDVTPDLATKVIAIPIPDAINTIATYPIAVTSSSPALAKTFVDYVLSDEGQRILNKWGFIPVRTPASSDRPDTFNRCQPDAEPATIIF